MICVAVHIQYLHAGEPCPSSSPLTTHGHRRSGHPSQRAVDDQKNQERRFSSSLRASRCVSQLSRANGLCGKLRCLRDLWAPEDVGPQLVPARPSMFPLLALYQGPLRLPRPCGTPEKQWNWPLHAGIPESSQYEPVLRWLVGYQGTFQVPAVPGPASALVPSLVWGWSEFATPRFR